MGLFFGPKATINSSHPFLEIFKMSQKEILEKLAEVLYAGVSCHNIQQREKLASGCHSTQRCRDVIY